MSELRSNQEWLHDLSAQGLLQEAAITDLRDLLLRAALFYFNRNAGVFDGYSHDEILQRAEDCAQDSLIAVMAHLPDFRGDSKFTTWVYKFAINNALMAARRERWKGISLDELSESGEAAYSKWVMENKSDGIGPEQAAMQGEVQAIIRDVIEHELTAIQRQVLLLMVFQDVPLDEVAHFLDTSRNTIYKRLHDARRKLKASLQERGFESEEAIALFGAAR